MGEEGGMTNLYDYIIFWNYDILELNIHNKMVLICIKIQFSKNKN